MNIIIFLIAMWIGNFFYLIFGGIARYDKMYGATEKKKSSSVYSVLGRYFFYIREYYLGRFRIQNTLESLWFAINSLLAIFVMLLFLFNMLKSLSFQIISCFAIFEIATYGIVFQYYFLFSFVFIILFWGVVFPNLLTNEKINSLNKIYRIDYAASVQVFGKDEFDLKKYVYLKEYRKKYMKGNVPKVLSSDRHVMPFISFCLSATKSIVLSYLMLLTANYVLPLI